MMITEQNEKDKVSYVSLRLLGMKYFKSRNKQHKFDTAPVGKQIWRETEVFRKLHFTQEQKLKIVKYIFASMYDFCQHALTQIEHWSF